MADSIRGLTIDITADTKKFNSAMKELRSTANDSQKELDALQKSLELKYDPKTLVKAQEAAQEAINITTKHAETLQNRLKHLEDSGKVDTTEYNRLKAELAKVEVKAQELGRTLTELNNKKFDELAKGFQNVGDAVSNAGKKLLPLSLGATAAIGTFGALGGKAISTASDISKLATQYGITAEALQRMNYIAMQTNTTSDDLQKAMVKVRSGMADLSTGAVSNTSKALQRLNIDLSQFENSDEQFYAIISALGNMEDKTQRVALANEIFGDKLANSLIPIISAGGSAISEYASEFEQVGAMSNEQVAALAEFDNVLNRIKTQFANVALQIGASFLPIMEKIAQFIETNIIPKLQKMSDWFNSLSLAQQEFAVKALLIVAALAPAAMLLGKVISSVGSLIGLIGSLKTALMGMSSIPIIAIIGAVVALLTVLYMKNEEFRDSINRLIGTLMSAFQPVLSALANILQTIINLLMPILDVFAGLFNLLIPFIEMALIPLQIQMKLLAVPLQLLGEMIKWLSPLLTIFADIMSKAFGVVIKVVNSVTKGIEAAVNFVIDIINRLIKLYNNTLALIPGVSKISSVSHVKLSFSEQGTNLPNGNIDTSGMPNAPTYPWDNIDTSGGNGDNYEYNYDNSNTTQNVTVVIENYAKEVDVDDLVRKINIKLAEAL